MDDETEAPIDDLEALDEYDDESLGDGGSGSRGGGAHQGGSSGGLAQS